MKISNSNSFGFVHVSNHPVIKVKAEPISTPPPPVKAKVKKKT